MRCAILGAVFAVAMITFASCVPLAGEAVSEGVAGTPTSDDAAEADGPDVVPDDFPPKLVHLSVKLAMLSDADAEKVRDEILPEWSPKEAQAGRVLDCLDFDALRAFYTFMRTETRGSTIQAPQSIVSDDEAVTIDFDETLRYVQAFTITSEDVRAHTPGRKEGDVSEVDLGIKMLVIPHVIGPEGNVILAVIPHTRPAQKEETKSGRSEMQLKGCVLVVPQLTEAPQRREPAEVSEGVPCSGKRLPSTATRITVGKARLRDRETIVVAAGRGEWQGEAVNLLLFITPTVIDSGKKVDIVDMMKRVPDARAQESRR